MIEFNTDAFNRPFVDVLDTNNVKKLTTDIALDSDGKSITNVILAGSASATPPGQIEMFWVCGEIYTEEHSLGKLSIKSINQQLSWPVPVNLLVQSSGKKTSLYYIYFPESGAQQIIGKTVSEMDKISFTVDIKTMPLYDIYVTGAVDHYQLAKSAYIYKLTHLDDMNHKWRSVSRGGCSHLAISDKGQLWGFGYNDTGTLGVGDNITKVEPRLCSFGEAGSHPSNIVQASTGFFYSAALDSDGYLYGAGNHAFGCLGDAMGDINTYDFHKIGERKYKFISASNLYQETYRGFTLFAIGKDDGQLYRSGWSAPNCNVHLSPSNDNAAITTMTKVEDGILSEHKWISVVQNCYMGAAINENNEVYVWGCSTNGCLGDDGNTGTYIPPHKLDFNGASPKITKVVLGGYHSMALDDQGNVWGWGYNDRNCLAQITTNGTRCKPVKISVMGESCQDIATDFYHSAAVTKSGNLYVWGHDVYGDVGLGQNDVYIATPTHVPFEEKIGAVQVGYWSMLVLSTGKL